MVTVALNLLGVSFKRKLKLDVKIFQLSTFAAFPHGEKGRGSGRMLRKNGMKPQEWQLLIDRTGFRSRLLEKGKRFKVN